MIKPNPETASRIEDNMAEFATLDNPSGISPSLMPLKDCIAQSKSDVATHAPQFLDTGLESLDEATGGFACGDLVIIGGRPAMGKTAFCLHVLRYNALHRKIPGLYIGFDAERATIITKIVCAELDMDLHKYRAVTEVRQTTLDNFSVQHPEPALFLDLGPTRSARELYETIRMATQQNGVRLVVIDDIIPLTEYWRKRLDKNIEYVILSFLADIARQEQCTILITVPLSRAVEERSDHTPVLSDLPEKSGRGVNTILLHRPGLYNLHDDSPRSDQELRIIIARDKRTNRERVVTVNLNTRTGRISDSR